MWDYKSGFILRHLKPAVEIVHNGHMRQHLPSPSRGGSFLEAKIGFIWTSLLSLGSYSHVSLNTQPISEAYVIILSSPVLTFTVLDSISMNATVLGIL